MAAWKIWLAYLAICCLLLGIMGLQYPPFQLGLLVQCSLILATFLLFMTPIIFPSLTIQWPWSRWWNAMDEQREYERWANSDSGQWFAAQQKALDDGEEIETPWSAFPYSNELGPMWSGWRQGSSEYWIKMIWYPFWSRLSKEERTAYLDKWQVPADWREYLLPEDEFFSLAAKEKDTIAGHVLNLWLAASGPDTTEPDHKNGEHET